MLCFVFFSCTAFRRAKTEERSTKMNRLVAIHLLLFNANVLVIVPLLLWCVAPAAVLANLPTFDEDSRMRILLLPVTTRVDTVIYRLRASDPEFDYPLQFSLVGRGGGGGGGGGGSLSPLLSLEPVPCTRQHSVCEANVLLKQPLEGSSQS